MEPESDQAREKAEAEKEKGNEAFNKKDFQTAIEFYNAAIKLDPACFIYYNNKAAALLAQNEFASCLKTCEEALQNATIKKEEGDPRSQLSKFYYRMGCAYEGLGDIKKAFHYVQHAVQTNTLRPACEKMLDLTKAINHIKEQPKRIGCNIVRRKLNDAAMHHFLLGNTPAASVLEKDARYENLLFGSDGSKKPIRFLFAGSGDARNLLTSLQHLSTILSQSVHYGPPRDLEVHMNDSNISILARNIVLLVIASESPADETLLSDEHLKTQTQHCCAIWMNTTLCDTHYETMIDILDRLLSDKVEELFPWLVFRGEALESLREVWKIWRHCPISHNTVLQMRREQMQKSPIIPHKTKEYRMWLQSGCLPFGDENGEICDKTNPTLLDYVTLEFCETQGPFCAFDELQAAADVSEKLVSKWAPLLSVFYKLLKDEKTTVKPSVHVWVGDVMKITEKVPEDTKFDFIDTSNLMDYLGLVNILVNMKPMLNTRNPYSCIQVENIIGTATTADKVLQLYCKIDPKKILMIMGLRSAEAENPSGNVRIKFFLEKPMSTVNLTVKEPLKEFYAKISSEPPFPDTPNPSMPFMMGRILPALTVGTMVGLLEIICTGYSTFPKEMVSGLLDELMDRDTPSKAFIRNRIFALRTLCAVAGERVVPSVKNVHSLPFSEVQNYCMLVEPVINLSQMRGGVGEPSLSVIMFKTKAICDQALKTPHGEPTYRLLKDMTHEECQVIDNISYNIHANILQFDLLRSDMEKMKEGMLAVLEVEKHFIICKPILISEVLEKHENK